MESRYDLQARVLSLQVEAENPLPIALQRASVRTSGALVDDGEVALGTLRPGERVRVRVPVHVRRGRALEADSLVSLRLLSDEVVGAAQIIVLHPQ